MLWSSFKGDKEFSNYWLVLGNVGFLDSLGLCINCVITKQKHSAITQLFGRNVW